MRMRTIAILICLSPVVRGTLEAQFVQARRVATTAEVVGGNILLGGITAAVRALASREDPVRAFAVGAFGGAVYLAGKNLAVEGGPVRAWAGTAMSGIGMSIVSNAGRGAYFLDEINVPIFVTRLRVTPRAEDKVRFALNAYETGTLIGALFTRGAALDWNRSMSSGSAVFVTRNRRIVLDGKGGYGGFAAHVAPVVFIDTAGWDPERVLRHEVIHVHQHWYMQDAWGRPIDDFVRRRLPGGRFIPRWIDLGLAARGLVTLEALPPGKSGLSHVVEAEAERLERR